MAAVTISVKNLVTREYKIAASADDGVLLAWSGSQVTVDRYLRVGQYTSGMRFGGIDIPPGAQIAGARLKLWAETTAAVDGRIQAEATGNAADLAGEGRSMLNMARTQAGITWNWTGKESANAWYDSPDCSAILQEIVGRPDWKAGNAVLLIYSGARTGSKDKDLTFYSRDYKAEYAPKLEIAYAVKSSTSAEPGQNPPTANGTDLYVSADTPTPIVLDAIDDGLPESLRFAISSLPSHGSLTFANGAAIKAPLAFGDATNRVIYTPDAGFSGDDSFTFCADDGGDAPTGGKSNTAMATLRVRHMVTREYQVIAQEDDAYGTDANTVVVSGTLSVGQHSSALRFRNIDLPQESEIISARLKLGMDTTNIDKPVEGTLCAQAVGDANDFNQADLRIPALPRTQASVAWNWPAGQTWARETYCTSPELRTVIQEIVDRDDWAAGNCMSILYEADASNAKEVQFFACDTPYSNRAAKIEITCVSGQGQSAASLPRREHPPSAKSVRLLVPLNESATIGLEATDDGFPASPGKLTYTIASLPSHGTLEIPGVGPITAVPTTPIDTGSEVVYKPNLDFTGNDTFTFYADDGGAAPKGGRSNTATVMLLVGTDISGEPPANLWQFDEGSGEISHDSTGNRHGTIHGGQWTAGRVGGALALDGVDDYVELPANEPVWLPQYDFTVAFWVYFDRGDTSKAMEVIFDLNCVKNWNPNNEHGAYIFKAGDSHKIGFQMITVGKSREDLYTNTVFDKGNWYHVVAVRSGARQQIYVNGELDNSGGCSSSPVDYIGAWDDNTVSLGSHSDPDEGIGNILVWQRTYYLKGKLDEVALYNRALSAADVRQLYEKQ